MSANIYAEFIEDFEAMSGKPWDTNPAYYHVSEAYKSIDYLTECIENMELDCEDGVYEVLAGVWRHLYHAKKRLESHKNI